MINCSPSTAGHRRTGRLPDQLYRHVTFAVVSCVALLANFSPAQDPGHRLRDVIDSHFQADYPKSKVATDAEFARRVSIDLTGMPPTADRLRSFLQDPSEDKREKLVQQLVASPHFERQLTTFLDVTLMERRAFKDIKEPEWTKYLLDSVRANKPWNILAQEILSADGTDENHRAAVRFALARDAEPNLLTRDIGRVFFGKDLQCAQCHNHPLVDDYLQSDYQGLLAFVAPGFVKSIQKPGPKTKDGKPGKPISLKIYAEKDGNDINFESVFVKDTKHRTGPRLIGEKSVMEADRLPVTTTTSNRPQHSRREVMATHATNGRNQPFNENIANRLWGLMMGRGLVHPPDFHHRDNPPLKPELLRALGEKMVEMKFDMRAFLSEIALSQVYQRAYEFPEFESAVAEIQQQLQLNKQRKSELEKEISQVVAAYDQANADWGNAESKHIPVAIEVEKLRGEFAKLTGESGKLKTAWETAKTSDAKQKELRDLLVKLTAEFKQVSSKLGDAEIVELNKKIVAKLGKTEAAAKASAAKSTAAEQKWKAAQAKVKSTEEKLKQGFAKRKPLLIALDDAEKKVREIRTQLDRLISKRTAIESEIATQEKLLSHVRLTQDLAELKNSGNGIKDSTGDQAVSKRQTLESDLNRLEGSLAVRLSNNHMVSSLRPLSPEQLCWSTLRVTGFYQRYYSAESGKLRKELKLKNDQALDLAQARIVEERTYKVLRGHLNNFVRYYAAGAGQPQGDFFATADQALFAANSGSINSYVNPAGDNVTDRMLKAQDHTQAAEELYLAILSRQPSKDEVATVDQYLKSKADNKRQAVMELAWSLINSAEFRFNH